MKANRLLLACALAALTTACASERRATSSPAPQPVPSPTARAAPAPPAASWRDVPLTPGDWSYSAGPGGSAARFGPGQGTALLSLNCDRQQGTVSLARAGAATTAVPLTITTTDNARAFTAMPEAAPAPTLVVRLGARDPFLDSLAFSRGRFAAETPGLPTLYLPAWAEIARVIEDCR